MEHIFSCRYELGCSTKSGRIPSGAGIRISVLKGRPRKQRDPPESPALPNHRSLETRLPLSSPLAIFIVTGQRLHATPWLNSNKGTKSFTGP